MLAYLVKVHFKSVGIYYPAGTIVTEEIFNDMNKLRLGRVKISEGHLVPIDSESDWRPKAQTVEARTGIRGLVEQLDQLFNPQVADEPPVEPEPKKVPKAATKAATKSTKK